MTEQSGFKKLDRRTVLAEDAGDAGDAAGEPGSEAMADDEPTYVQTLEQRARLAEEQLARYIHAYKSEVEGELQKRLERLGREAQKELDRLRGEMAVELLEVLDNFDRSLAALQGGADQDALRQGLTLVREQFWGALQRMGVSAVGAAEAPFDPHLHEAAAVAPVNDPEKDGRVVAVLKEGYLLGERVIRPAVVQVGRLMS